jgi:hypothetical protein
MAHTLEHGPHTVYKIGADGWTAEDEARLRGPRPHVMSRGAPFYIGTMPLEGFAPLSGSVCRLCKQSKVHERERDGCGFCFGCGAVQ